MSNTKESDMLEEVQNSKISDARQKTSSDLLYSEYINTSGLERLTKIFEKKKEKPVMLSYGESPLYKKYSDLLTELKESEDVLPSDQDENAPIVEMEVFLKQNIDDDSDDIEDGRIIVCEKKDEDTSDEETSEDDDVDTSSIKRNNKVQVLSEDNELGIENEKSESIRIASPVSDCDLNKNCDTVAEKNDDYKPTAKRLRLD